MGYEATFIGRQKLAGEVTLFRFEKPREFRYLPGQYCVVTVPDTGISDARGLSRAFSIASSPLEKELLFVMKLSESALKQTMARMEPGTMMTLGEPRGSLILPDDATIPLAFLAGGIGIAPFRSLCRYATDAKTAHAITLFYSSRTPEETPFLDELQQLPAQNGRLRVIVTMTRAGDDPRKWTGLTGRLSAEMLQGHLQRWREAQYYIAGPPAMADAMKKTLEGMEVPGSRIRIELFAGA